MTRTSLLVLLDDARQESTVADLSELVNDTASSQTGLAGLSLRGCLAAVKKLDSNAVSKGLISAYPEIIKAMDSYWKTYQTSVDCCFGMHLENDRIGVAGKLMGILDRRVELLGNPAVLRLYEASRLRVRRALESHVGEVGNVLEENLG